MNLKLSNRVAGYLFLLYLLGGILAEDDGIYIDSIEPEAGLLSGGTRVLVRGGPFKKQERKFKSPKCKFGTNNRIVNASYVKCTT